MKLALIKNNVVKSIADVSTEEEAQELAHAYEAIIDITDTVPQPQVGWFLSGNKLVTNGTNGALKITKLAFRQRFTFTELVNLETASLTNAMVRVLKDNLAMSNYVDLSRPDTIGGVGLLYSLGLITAERMNIILTTIPTELELYKD